MQSIPVGTYIMQPGGFKAFIPGHFPPDQGYDFSLSVLEKNTKATYLLGKLDGITRLLPDADYFLLMYQKKDAASSSQIEGTKATMSDAIEADVKKGEGLPDDVDDILHYISALNYGTDRMKQDKFPLSLRLIKEVHKELMQEARATQYSDPGAFRQSQNWIGGTRPDNASYVPPPVGEMLACLGDLESFMHSEDSIPEVIKAGIIHAQFETIHPFLDGNGRTGRMMVTLFLWKEGLLEKPVLFLSSYFRQHRQLYYDKLAGYHEGKIGEWIEFFLNGIIEVSEKAIAMAGDINDLRERDVLKIQSLGKRASESAGTVFPRLFGQPIVTVATVQQWTGFTRAGAQRVIDRFIEKDILVPKTQNSTYAQSYVYREYLDIFTADD